MVNLRSRSTAKNVAPRAVLKRGLAVPAPSAASDNLDLSEVALRQLPRAKLQKLAMAHKVKANMKSELIIRQMSSLQLPRKTRPAEVDLEEGPLRKRFKREVTSEEAPISSTPESQIALLSAQPAKDAPAQGIERLGPDSNIRRDADRVDSHPPLAGPSTPRSISIAHKAPVALPYDQELFSGTESEMTEDEQLDFATPVSSREETPPAANVKDLQRCVKIMREISEKDIALLNQAMDVREIAAKLRKRARDVRDLVKAETGRRERMEAYFRYWQEIEPTWHRRWLYGEKMVPEYKIRLEEVDGPAGPPTIPTRQNAQGPGCARPRGKPMLSPEEVKQKREAIVSKQQAEQRQLEEMQAERSPGEWSSEAGNLGESSGLAHPSQSAGRNVNQILTIPFEDSVETTTFPAPSP